MSNIDPKEICGNCIHFAKEQRGECRKYAPRGGGDRMWTHVRENEWCSEFKWGYQEGKPIEQDHTE